MHFGRPLIAAALLALLAVPAAATEPVPPPGQGTAASAQSSMNTAIETARLDESGVLFGEFAYRAAIGAYATRFRDLTLHTGHLLLGYGVDERMEFRAGWDMFGLVNDDFSSISGAGDPWFEGKFAIANLPQADFPHGLAIVGRFRPGIGQDPVSIPGVTMAAAALYTMRFEKLEVDVNAGVQVNTSDAPSYFSLPFGGRAVWLALDQVDVYGEIVETLHFTDLRASETQIDAGCALRPVDAVEFTVTGGLGLSESLPAGFIQLGVAFQMADFGQN